METGFEGNLKMGKIRIAPLPTLAITTSALLLKLLAPAPHTGGVQLELLACLCSTCLASTFLCPFGYFCPQSASQALAEQFYRMQLQFLQHNFSFFFTRSQSSYFKL